MEDPADSGPPPPAVTLAHRLRELRENAQVRLTQEDLGRALGRRGEDDGVSPTTISLWENPANDRIPPPHRLQAYAQLFCTSRSFDGGTPHLIPLSDLDARERLAYSDLRTELLDLRSHSTRGDVALPPSGRTQPRPTDPGFGSTSPLGVSGLPSEVWHFPDGKPITIVCGRLPADHQPPQADVANLNYVRMARFADLDTLVDVYGIVKAANPDSLVILTTAKEMTRVDALNHLILIGNTELNLAGRWFARHIELPVTVDDTGVHRGEETYRYTLEDGELIEDVGVFVRGPHPSAPHRTLIMCNGITTRGVRGAAQTFLNPTVRERNARWAAERFPAGAIQCVVMRVPVLNGEPLPQDLADPASRLFEWHS